MLLALSNEFIYLIILLLSLPKKYQPLRINLFVCSFYKMQKPILSMVFHLISFKSFKPCLGTICQITHSICFPNNKVARNISKMSYK